MGEAIVSLACKTDGSHNCLVLSVPEHAAVHWRSTSVFMSLKTMAMSREEAQSREHADRILKCLLSTTRGVSKPMMLLD